MDLNTYVSAALILEGDRMLVSRRTNGFWEFPGGKIETGEHPRQSVERELMEELGLVIEAGPVFDILVYPYPQRHVIMPLYLCVLPYPQIPQLLDGPVDVKWVRLSEVEPEEFLPADRELLHRFRGQPERVLEKAGFLWNTWREEREPHA